MPQLLPVYSDCLQRGCSESILSFVRSAPNSLKGSSSFAAYKVSNLSDNRGMMHPINFSKCEAQQGSGFCFDQGFIRCWVNLPESRSDENTPSCEEKSQDLSHECPNLEPRLQVSVSGFIETYEELELLHQAIQKRLRELSSTSLGKEAYKGEKAERNRELGIVQEAMSCYKEKKHTLPVHLIKRLGKTQLYWGVSKDKEHFINRLEQVPVGLNTQQA